MEPFAPAIKAFFSLLVIINPIGAAPMFLGLTEGATHQERGNIARAASVATVVILLISGLLGKQILEFFGISLPSFRVAGGILFLFMGIDMLNARQSASRSAPEEIEEASHRKDIAVVPIAIPQLAGPGAIGSVILFADKGPWLTQMGTLVVIVGLCGIISYLALRAAVPIGNRLGTTGKNVLNRILGLIMTAVAVEFAVSGLKVMWGA